MTVPEIRELVEGEPSVEQIEQLIEANDVKHLEAIILNGYGNKLQNSTTKSSHSATKSLISNTASYMVR